VTTSPSLVWLMIESAYSAPLSSIQNRLKFGVSFVYVFASNSMIAVAAYGVAAVGAPKNGLQVKNSTIRGTHAYGIHVGHPTDNLLISGVTIANAGGICTHVEAATNAIISGNKLAEGVKLLRETAPGLKEADFARNSGDRCTKE